MSERSYRTSKRTNEWPSTYAFVLSCGERIEANKSGLGMTLATIPNEKIEQRLLLEKTRTTRNSKRANKNAQSRKDSGF